MALTRCQVRGAFSSYATNYGQGSVGLSDLPTSPLLPLCHCSRAHCVGGISGCNEHGLDTEMMPCFAVEARESQLTLADFTLGGYMTAYVRQ